MKLAPAQANDLNIYQDDEALQESWSEVLRLGADATIVAAARVRCDGLLKAHRAEPLELTMLDWAVFLRQHIPDLVSACKNELDMGEDGAARAELLRQVAEALEMIGLEAERRRDAGRAVTHRRFALAHVHALERASEIRPDFMDVSLR